jgi:C-terminal processing protease CtpA/Prc
MVSLRVTERTVTAGTSLSGVSASPSAIKPTTVLDVPVLVRAGTKGPEKVSPAAATHALRTQMYDVLHQVANHFRLRYGPLGYKKAKFDWEPDAAEAAAKKQVAAITSDASLTPDDMVTRFHGVLRDFVNGTHDYHVGITFTRTEAATLPFRVQVGPTGRVFVSGVDEGKEKSFPFEIGDEITTVDGKPVAEVLHDLQKYSTSSNAITDLRDAANTLTKRRPSRGVPTPEKPSTLFGITRMDGSTATFDAAWTTTPEGVTFSQAGFSSLQLRQKMVDRNGPDMTAHGVIDQAAIAAANARAAAAKKGEEPDGDGWVVGARKSFVPVLGPIVTSTGPKDPFDAYIYRSPNGKNIGVIRIPEYSPDKPEEMAKAFAELIANFEQATDALVIDQNNNPGGLFFYMMALLSHLSPHAMKMTGQAEAITPQEVFDAQNNIAELKSVKDDKTAVKVLGKTVAGLPVTYDLVVRMRASNQHIIDEWNKGKKMTSSFPLEGIDSMNPSTTSTYTKPILCLVNSLCFSCGDFFPAALQTNGRAVIFGETTAGAGGYVLTHKFVNGLGIESLHLTGSIADRGTVHADGSVTDDPDTLENPIESVGVKPDIVYSPTDEDLQNGYEGYRNAVNATIVKMTSEAA